MAEKKRLAAREILTLDQWVEVRSEHGNTITALYPSNDALLQKLLNMSPPPDLVYRRIIFRGGVPEEYDWVEPTAQQKQFGGICVQRLTVEGWQEQLLDEALSGVHLKASTDPRPRPRVRGECDCLSCVANRQRLEDLGIEPL